MGVTVYILGTSPSHVPVTRSLGHQHLTHRLPDLVLKPGIPALDLIPNLSILIPF